MELYALVLLLFSTCIGAPIKEKPESSLMSHPVFPNLRFVANVDGKSFFADDTLRDWLTSKTYCDSLGMKLASITSKAQFDALDGAVTSAYFTGSHWTSGRDAQIHRQFSWDATDQQISHEYLPFLSQNTLPFQTCVYFRAQSSSGLRFWDCDYLYKVLCET